MAKQADQTVTVLYDGECPICEANRCFLSGDDDTAGKVTFEDVRSANFRASDYGVSQRVSGRLNPKVAERAQQFHVRLAGGAG